MKAIVFVALLAFGIAAPAAADITLIVRSNPAGATVYRYGVWLGTAPVAVQVKTPLFFRHCVTTASIQVKWVSGVESAARIVELCPSDRWWEKPQIVFERPSGFAGLELDVTYAMHVEQLEEMREQTRSQERTAALNRLSQWTLETRRQQSNVEQLRTLQQSMTCTSQQVGATIFTNCR